MSQCLYFPPFNEIKCASNRPPIIQTVYAAFEISRLLSCLPVLYYLIRKVIHTCLKTLINLINCCGNTDNTKQSPPYTYADLFRLLFLYESSLNFLPSIRILNCTKDLFLKRNISISICTKDMGLHYTKTIQFCICTKGLFRNLYETSGFSSFPRYHLLSLYLAIQS